MERKSFNLFMVLTLCLALPTTTLAAKAALVVAGQAWWQTLLYTVIQLALAIFIPVLGVLVWSLLNRWGIKIEKEQVDKIAEQAADWAEHKAKVALKEDGKKTPGAEKMRLALDFAQQMANKYKLQEQAKDKLSKLIESAVAKKEQTEKKPQEVNKDTSLKV